MVKYVPQSTQQAYESSLPEAPCRLLRHLASLTAAAQPSQLIEI